MEQLRGSKKLLAAWERRVLTDESVKELSEVLEKSVGTVERVHFVGGERATGVNLALTYSGDDIDRCGNDLSMWIRWLRRYGGQPRPPKIIIDGIPFPDFLRMELASGPDLAEVTVLDPGKIGGFDIGQLGGPRRS